jgi:hypothetical protein
MDLREIGWDGRDRIDLAQDKDQWRALVNTVMNLRVPWEVLDWLHNWQLLTKGSAPRVSEYIFVSFSSGFRNQRLMTFSKRIF